MDGEFQKEAKKAGLFDVPVSSCEAELQELMRQIDIMVHNRKLEWEADLEGVRGHLRLREQEVASQRAALEAKHLEVGRLRHQVDSSETDKRLLAAKYEQKLTQLRAQLASLQRDYMKVERHHSKHAVGAEREKNQANLQLQEAQSQLKATQATIQDHQKSANEWEIQKRAYRQQIESLETQRKTLADKCQLVQQQSSGYQEQLTKQRHLLEQTELNFRSRLAHLEGCLTRSQDTVEDKSALVQRLEERLRQVDGGRQDERGERMEIEERCRTAESRLKRLEDDKAQLTSELQSRDDLITKAEQAMKRQKQEAARMTEAIALKDDMIRSLKEENRQEAQVQVREVQGQLDQAQREISRLRNKEGHLQEDVQRLQARLDESHLDCARLNTELASKIDELRRLEGTEMQQLQDQLAKAVAKHDDLEQRYLSHLDGMRSEVAALTSDLHQRDSTLATLSHKLASLEREEREEVQRAERYQHELRITNAQLDALRTENRSLRDVGGQDASVVSPEIPSAQQLQLQELRNTQTQQVKASKILEEENSTLRRKLTSLTQQLLELESASDIKYQAAIKQSHLRIAELTQEYERKLVKAVERQNHQAETLQSRLEATVQQDEAEISRLREMCRSLKEQLKEQTHLINRLRGEHSAMAGFVSNVETIATSPPHPRTSPAPETSPSSRPHRQSPKLSPRPSPSARPSHRPTSATTTPRARHPSPAARKLFDDDRGSAAMPEILGFPEFVIPSGEWDSKRPDSRQSITASFVAEDLRRTEDLERLLDGHIASLEEVTEDTIRRTRFAGDGGGGGSSQPEPQDQAKS